jgi:hypothetical protein
MNSSGQHADDFTRTRWSMVCRLRGTRVPDTHNAFAAGDMADGRRALRAALAGTA